MFRSFLKQLVTKSVTNISNKLPDEIWLIICTFLEIPDIRNFCRVSWRFYGIGTDDSLWEKIAQRHFYYTEMRSIIAATGKSWRTGYLEFLRTFISTSVMKAHPDMGTEHIVIRLRGDGQCFISCLCGKCMKLGHTNNAYFCEGTTHYLVPVSDYNNIIYHRSQDAKGMMSMIPTTRKYEERLVVKKAQSEFSGSNIVKVSANYPYVLFLSDSGKCFSMMIIPKSELSYRNYTIPTKVLLMDSPYIHDVTAADVGNFAFTDRGIFFWIDTAEGIYSSMSPINLDGFKATSVHADNTTVTFIGPSGEKKIPAVKLYEDF